MQKTVIPPVFRRQVYKVIGSILLFMLVYLLLVAAAIVVAIGCFYLGGLIMLGLHSFFAIIFGLGLMAAGVSLLIFLVKFIFAVSKDENSQRVEITKKEQPRLFAFIRQLTQETGTAFPRRVFVSPDVNACVFYNSTFWSMFFPIRKNLEIGLGLVNSVNISEFKAVMGHEFGHFSQRSMKLGAFTYNVNKVIHNMLYENKGYTKFLNSWGRIHSAMALFATITYRTAQGIQWILRGMYKVINKNYLGLSREMEFHADAVAASVAGGNNLVNALSRTEVAGKCYHTALNEANGWIRDNRIFRNIFSNQLTIMRSVAADYGLPVKDGLPAISYHFVASFTRSRINFRNQWASHPTLEERKTHLDGLMPETGTDEAPAWSLFDQAETLQESLTANLYRSVKPEAPPVVVESAAFEQAYLSRKAEYALPGVYKGFYDERYIDVKDWDFEQLAQQPGSGLTFADIFNDETGQLQGAIATNRKDAELARAIKSKQVDVKTFDFDGKKVHAEDGELVALQLEKDIAGLEQRQRSLDKEAFLYFLHRPGASRDRILENYRKWQSTHGTYTEYVNTVNRLLAKIRPLYEDRLGIETITVIIDQLKGQEEPKLKQKYRDLMNAGVLAPEVDGQLYERVQDFVGKDYAYFINKSFQNHELSELKGLAIGVANALNQSQFRCYKQMLCEQLEGVTL